MAVPSLNPNDILILILLLRALPVALDFAPTPDLDSDHSRSDPRKLMTTFKRACSRTHTARAESSMPIIAGSDALSKTHELPTDHQMYNVITVSSVKERVCFCR